MSVSNVYTASSNQSITPPHNTQGCDGAAVAAVAATVLVPTTAAASLPSPSLAASGKASLVSTETSPESSLEFNKALFDRLPDEMIVSMLMKLSVKEIVRMREVDTRFRDIGRETLAKKISDENIPLVKLGLKGNAKVLAFLLKSLGPENCIYIKQLNLLGTEVDNSFLAGLSSLTPNLQGLNLAGGGDRITYEGFNYLASLTQLQSLTLSGCVFITDDVLQRLSPLTQLQKLKLAGCPQITNACLNHLAPFKKLQNLDLAFCQITDDGLQRLSPLSQLQKLNLTGCYRVTNVGLNHLAPLTEYRAS